MIALQLLLFGLVAVGGLAVVRSREPVAQAIAVSFFGLVLAMLFFVHQAPDVALSQLTVGAVALPLMILLAVGRIRRNEQLRELQRKANEERRP